jgi:hypothetical protein
MEGIDAATMFGLSASEYLDLEVHDDEWATVAPAGVISCVAGFFGIEWWACAAWRSGSFKSIGNRLDEFCRELREANGLSREDFSDRVGFNPSFCEVIEGHADGLSLWPVEVARLMAQEFDVDERALIGKLLRLPAPEFA